MGFLRPQRRRFWFWWDKRRRWHALDVMLADPVAKNGLVTSVCSEGVFIEVPDGRRFFWEFRVMNSLLGLPDSGVFEPAETTLLSSLLRDTDTVLDIGANFGWYTTLFSRKVGPGGAVHAFEPVPATFQELRKNVRLNGSPDNIRLNALALGERDGKITINVPTRIWLGEAFASAVIQHEGPHASFQCEMKTLDGYLAENGLGKVDIIKCDVEGGELNVLRGARKMLSSPVPPVWFLEVQESSTVPFGYMPQDLFSHLRGYGYECYHLSKGKLRLTSLSGKSPDYNFLFLIPDLHRARVENLLG